MLLIIKQILLGVSHDEIANIAKGGYSYYPEAKMEINEFFNYIHKQLK
jgi:phage pi2 protein 07